MGTNKQQTYRAIQPTTVGDKKIPVGKDFTVTPEPKGRLVTVMATGWQRPVKVDRNWVDENLVELRTIELPAYA